jgi:hypothetical protein
VNWDNEPRRDQPLQQEIGRHRSRKNTRDWCKGKVGRPHELGEPQRKYNMACRVTWWFRHPRGEAVVAPQWYCSHYDTCQRCGKLLHRIDPERCPDRPAQLPESRQHPYAQRRHA